jgi:DNA-binding beta-propeller fold protein YncE
LLVAAAVLAGMALAGVLTFSGGAKAVVVRPDSVAVIDPADNALVDDIAVGGYPGPLAADGKSVYVCNIGDATVSSIDPAAKKVSSTFSLSRAIDLVAVNEHLWAADGGVAGHTPYPPGTVVDLEFYSFETRSIRVGPSFEGYGGNEASTTIAADADGAQVWAGSKESETLTQLEPMTMAKLHGVRPGGVAVVGSAGTRDTIWASDQSRDLVVRIDGSSRRITHRIAVPGQPARIVADNRAVWVTTRGTADLAQWPPTRATHPAVWRIDTKSNEAVDRIALPLLPIRIALGAGAVWVTAERVLSSDGSTVDATVFRIDPATSRIVARIPLHTRAVDGIIVSHGLIWVAVPPSQ